MYEESMRHFHGPCWNQKEEYLLRQMDSERSSTRITDGYMEKAKRILSILSKSRASGEKEISREELASLEETGIAAPQIAGDENKTRSAFVLQVGRLENREIHNELLAVGSRVKEKHKRAWKAMNACSPQEASNSAGCWVNPKFCVNSI